MKRDRNAGRWVLRVTVHGKRREMGLGPWPEVGLADARVKAERAHRQVRSGFDPIAEREKEKRQAQRNLHSLSEVTTDCFDSKKAELKDDGIAGRWMTPLRLHILPKLGAVPIVQIDQQMIRDSLTPIWHSKAETARKCANRLNIVFRHAAALGLDVDLQAVEKARLLLGKQRHIPQKIPAMAWQDLPRFWQKIEDPISSHLALKLLILTGLRSDPIRHANLIDMDQDLGVWTVPALRVKGRVGQVEDFRVPLSNEALEVIQSAQQLSIDGFLFCGPRGKPVSDMTLSKRMRDLDEKARPHGFRSSFRTWAEETNQPWNVAETTLGHRIGAVVERSYQRSDLLEQRRALLEKWAHYVTGRTGSISSIRDTG